MKVTKKQLRDIVRRVKGQTTNEAMDVSGDAYWKMRDRMRKSFEAIMDLCDELEDAMYEETGAVDPFDLVDQIRDRAGEHVR